MKVLVLGSGVLGITTAYVLASRGHEVEILERRDCCAAETSYANGGQLSYSHAEPWGSPAVLKKLPKWLIHEDSPLIFRPRADMAMFKWGLQFLRNCTLERARINCVNMLRLGLYSKEKMADIIRETGITFDENANGILHIFSTQKDLDHAVAQSEFQAKFGCVQNILNKEQVLALEPSLRETERDIMGGLHSIMDECGDALLYCQRLLEYAEKNLNVRIRYGVNITSIASDNDTISSVVTDQGEFKADAYIMALGSYSPLYLKPLGIHVPIYPMKGYSLTIPADEHCPHLSITDGSVKVVYSRLGSRLRVAGTAEFSGYNHDIVESRIKPIINAGRKLFPNAAWDSPEMTKWACLRPSTPDGPPIIGQTPYRNLYLNTGHGTLGWTQGAGSAYLLADIMEQRAPAILMAGLTLRS